MTSSRQENEKARSRSKGEVYRKNGEQTPHFPAKALTNCQLGEKEKQEIQGRPHQERLRERQNAELLPGQALFRDWQNLELLPDRADPARLPGKGLLPGRREQELLPDPPDAGLLPGRMIRARLPGQANQGLLQRAPERVKVSEPPKALKPGKNPQPAQSVPMIVLSA
ncbi:hypothetical protein EDD80_106175 [Anseongella ginsenosidimutans]|uniref:Uncharacterized protein n=1 Tax=Anseongella ginsenosidimutans TaxID=496056 RepID=A0A4R3KQ24_9SPHI|nr:hypothetical protein EDD80_106175 [Anseongella ginsenosidimutans]